MEKGAGERAERSIKMDERDVCISKMRQELEDKDAETQALYARIALVRQELEEREKELTEIKGQLEEVKANYHDMRDRYTQLMGHIMMLIAKLKE